MTKTRNNMYYVAWEYTQMEIPNISQFASWNNNNNTCLMPLCPGLPGWAGTKKYQSGFTGAKDSEWQWHQLSHNANLHLTPDR